MNTIDPATAKAYIEIVWDCNSQLTFWPGQMINTVVNQIQTNTITPGAAEHITTIVKQLRGLTRDEHIDYLNNSYQQGDFGRIV